MNTLQANYSTFRNLFSANTVYYRTLDLNSGSFQLSAIVDGQYISCLIIDSASVSDFTTNFVSSSVSVSSIDDAFVLTALSGTRTDVAILSAVGVGATGSSGPSQAFLIGGNDDYGILRGIANKSGSLSTFMGYPSVTVLSNVTITGSGQTPTISFPFPTSEVSMIVNVSGAITDESSITFTLQEVDPGDQATVLNSTAVTYNSSSTSGLPVHTTRRILNTASPYFNVKWAANLGQHITASNVYVSVCSKFASSPFISTVTNNNFPVAMLGAYDNGQVARPLTVAFDAGGGLGGLLVAGWDSNTSTYRTLFVDDNRGLGVVGLASPGSSRLGAPVPMAGTDGGGLIRTLSTDTGGILIVSNSFNGPASPGNSAAFSALAGGQFNLTPPSGASGQQMALQLDQDGGLYVDTEGRRSTYSATIAKLVPGTTASDIFLISGSATRTVRVERVDVSGWQTGGPFVGLISVQLLKRSSQNTAGTFTNVIRVPHDSNDPAATAGVLAYTTNPTLGTLVGPIRSTKLYLTSSAAAPNAQPASFAEPSIVWDFVNRNGKPLILRSVNEAIVVNLSGTTITGGSFDISVEWTEE